MKGLISNTFRCLPFVLFGLPVLADVPAYPPQNVPSMHTLATAGNGQVISGRVNGVGYSWDTNGTTIKVDRFQNVNRGSGGLTGYKTNPVNLYDNYGNVARGQIQTQTALPPTSTTAKLGAAMYAMQIVGGAAQAQGPAIGTALAQGDYKAAGQYAVLGTLQSAKAAGDWATGGLIGGAESIWEAYHNAKNPNNAGEALMQEAARKAEETAKRYQQQYEQSQAYQDYLPQANGKPKAYPSLLIVNGGNLAGVYIVPPLSGTHSGGYIDQITLTLRDGGTFTLGQVCRGACPYQGGYRAENIDEKNYQQYLPQIQQAVAAAQPQPTIEDFLLTQAEAQNVLAKYMEQMLNDNNRNHTELMNALWAGGGLNPGNTQSMVMGSPGDNTFLTEPYTPVGSNQAQQTQFTVNKDGTVTQTIVQRPDLAANTSQAPTRAEVGQQQSQQDTRPAKSDSTAEKPDICAQNPNSMMCAPMGNMDYQDIVLPQQNINIALSPLHIFNTDAACPAPTSFNIAGTSQSLSYEPMCDTARKARPFVIMMAMTAAFLMVFSALNRR